MIYTIIILIYIQKHIQYYNFNNIVQIIKSRLKMNLKLTQKIKISKKH